MDDSDIKKMLAMDHEMLMVLQHFQMAKLDYAKNIKIYTSIPQANVQIYIERLYSMGLIEKYDGASVKRTQAKLKKTNEVHKHHTYYTIANKGHYILKDMTEREYIKYVETECLRLLLLKRERKENPDKCKKLYRMGLMDKNYEPTDMGRSVLDLARRRQIKIL
jgi:predicted transcriptional regulator